MLPHRHARYQLSLVVCVYVPVCDGENQISSCSDLLSHNVRVCVHVCLCVPKDKKCVQSLLCVLLCARRCLQCCCTKLPPHTHTRMEHYHRSTTREYTHTHVRCGVRVGLWGGRVNVEHCDYELGCVCVQINTPPCASHTDAYVHSGCVCIQIQVEPALWLRVCECVRSRRSDSLTIHVHALFRDVLWPAHMKVAQLRRRHARTHAHTHA